jgi:hypothetical protein
MPEKMLWKSAKQLVKRLIMQPNSQVEHEAGSGTQVERANACYIRVRRADTAVRFCHI